jgi:deoxyadenosine/deoxycytidine kinase
MTSTGPFVAVGGNIATGKSSLVDALGDALGLHTFPERWEDNPWFGSTPDRTLASQLWFLVSAAADNAQIADGAGGIQERCIHEHALVFASNALSDDDARLLEDTYSMFDELLPSPHLLVFLHASPQELERRVRRRGRPQEADLTLERLIGLDAHYRTFIENWTRCPVVPVDMEHFDLRVDEDLRHVTTLIERGLI